MLTPKDIVDKPRPQTDIRGSGIYMIYNSIENRAYIGQAKKLSTRIASHRRELERGIHTNEDIRASFNKDGAENFQFIVLFNCPIDELDKYEVELLLSIDRNCLLNQRTVKNPAGTWIGRVTHGPEARARISAASKGRVISQEHRAILSKLKKGVKMPPETKARMRERMLGRKRAVSPEEMVRLKLGKVPRSLQEEIVRFIKIDLSNEVPICDICRKYEVSRSVVTGIAKNRNYKEIKIS